MMLTLPTQRDPVARITLGGLFVATMALMLIVPGLPALPAEAQVQPIVVIATATPTLGMPAIEQAPIAAMGAPTLAPPPTAAPAMVPPQVVEVPIYVEVTVAPPPPTDEPAPVEVPAGARTIIILPTATQTRQEFIDSFATPDPNASCAFVGRLDCPRPATP